jgi:hypothetical protein
MVDQKAAQRERREERRATELRENLKRRKVQARARVRLDGNEAAESPNSAGIAADKRKDEAG